MCVFFLIVKRALRSSSEEQIKSPWGDDSPNIGNINKTKKNPTKWIKMALLIKEVLNNSQWLSLL